VCHNSFTRNDNLKRHIAKVHSNIAQNLPTQEVYQTLISKIDKLEEKLEERDEQMSQKFNELKNTPVNNIANSFNVICVTGRDNYLDMLANKIGDFNKAIEYIKDCALSSINGDCKLIEKMYTDQNQRLGFSINSKHSRITYYDENKEQVTENKEIFGSKLANNLQKTFLKSINYLINQNLEQRKNPNQLLDDYDMIEWNRHIYNLSDPSYQRKILNQLRIPLLLKDI